MNAILTAVLNAAITSAPVTALIWLGLRLTSPRILSAAARYVVWWVALAITIALPFVYLPAHPSVPAPSKAPAASKELAGTTEPGVAVPCVVPSCFEGRPGPAPPPRFPLHVKAGSRTKWISTWISAAWALAAFLFLLRLAVSCALLSGRKARARILSTTIDASTGRTIRMAVSDEVSAPMAAGFLRPTILIPARFLGQLDASELELIALHEAAHFARRDDYALILERIVEAVFALHPLVRWIARQIDLEREIACDDRVVEATGRPRPYAVCLTRVAELTGGLRASFSAAAATREGSHLTRRVEMLLDKTRDTGIQRRTRWLKTRLACALAVVSALAWMAARTPAVLAFTTPPAVTIAIPLAPPKPAPRLIAQGLNPQVAPAPPPPAPQRPVAAAPPSPVVFEDVQVTDSQDRIVAGLARENFHIFEDDVEQQITSFSEVSEPASVGVVSQYPDGITLAIQEDLVRLQQTVPVKIEFMETADPNLRFRDAAEPAMDRIRQEGHSMRRVILLFNDGGPVIGSLRRVGDTSPPKWEGRAVINTYTEAGVAVFSFRAGMNNTMQGLARLRVLNGGIHYVLGYTSLKDSTDGKFKDVRVKLSPPNGLPLRLDVLPSSYATNAK